MEKYWEIFVNGYKGYANYLWSEITNPNWHNYFYWLIGVSAFFFLLEILRPWRRDQAKFRKDFWLDFFYMFFNFFLFSLIIYNAASDVVVNFFNDTLASIGITNLVAFEVMSWPTWAHLVIGFLVRDFVQWWTHRLLHWHPKLWDFHKVHHSVEQMGFAAHLRYHWMENVVYRTLEYIPLALIGIGLRDFFIIHIFTLAVGHFNHSNFKINLGPLKYIFNNPQMHIWHHVHDLPEGYKYGINFGITLSVWDYLFGTASIPHDGRDIKLGFPGVEKFPKTFVKQNLFGFGLTKDEKLFKEEELQAFSLDREKLNGNGKPKENGKPKLPEVKDDDLSVV
jgi:sterol desaturase/sphingolipid hydroxylase (fatty acid hydroxylase superfamily)